MQLIGTGTETYILLNGIVVSKDIPLSDNVILQPANTAHLTLSATLSACTHPDDIAVAAAFIPRITAQLQIKASSSKEVAVIAWNSSWDMLLLASLLGIEIGFNLQSNVSSEIISEKTSLNATNLYMHGITNAPPYEVTKDDYVWITEHFGKARKLLDNSKFKTAVHCLASFRWHSLPRVQLVILWAGIEGMFGASSEIRFRISLYIEVFCTQINMSNNVQYLSRLKSSTTPVLRLYTAPKLKVSAQIQLSHLRRYFGILFESVQNANHCRRKMNLYHNCGIVTKSMIFAVY